MRLIQTIFASKGERSSRPPFYRASSCVKIVTSRNQKKDLQLVDSFTRKEWTDFDLSVLATERRISIPHLDSNLEQGMVKVKTLLLPLELVP